MANITAKGDREGREANSGYIESLIYNLIFNFQSRITLQNCSRPSNSCKVNYRQDWRKVYVFITPEMEADKDYKHNYLQADVRV